MLFNMMAGKAMELGTASGSISNLNAPQVLDIPLAVAPLMVALRTTVGSISELAVYYRPAPYGEYSLRLSSQGVARCRLGGDGPNGVIASLTGASAANVASVEYWVLGVKK